MGWRATAQNLNLNRDYVKAEAPEMQAMLRLLERVGSDRSTSTCTSPTAPSSSTTSSIKVEPRWPATPRCARPAAACSATRDARPDRAAARCRSTSIRPSMDDDDPSSGFAVDVGPPRFSQATGRCATASACWSRRIRGRTTRRACGSRAHRSSSCSRLAARTAPPGSRPRGRRRAHGDAARRQPVPLTTRPPTTRADRVPRLRLHAHAVGDLRRADDSLRRRSREIWRIPLATSVQPSLSVDAPRAGYLVPAAQAAWWRRSWRCTASRSAC